MCVRHLIVTHFQIRTTNRFVLSEFHVALSVLFIILVLLPLLLISCKLNRALRCVVSLINDWRAISRFLFVTVIIIPVSVRLLVVCTKVVSLDCDEILFVSPIVFLHLDRFIFVASSPHIDTAQEQLRNRKLVKKTLLEQRTKKTGKSYMARLSSVEYLRLSQCVRCECCTLCV